MEKPWKNSTGLLSCGRIFDFFVTFFQISKLTKNVKLGFQLQNQLKERTDSFNEKEQQSKDERDRLASELAQSVAEYKRDLAIAEARLQDSEELKKMGGKEVEQLKAEVDSLRQQVGSLQLRIPNYDPNCLSFFS